MKFVCTLIVCLFLVAGNVWSQEVGKGQIPAGHLNTNLKVLPWDVAAWDVPEAVTALKDKESKILWVDTRPTSFFEQGTVRKAALLVYDKSGATYPAGEPVCTQETLKAAMDAAGAEMVVFFCQGPKCHRSYNAAYVAVKEWGLDAANVVWFRGGYPNLFKTVGDTPKLKRKGKRYLCDSSLAKM